ncbi:MAG: hypothetical protein R2771_11230 [Saprospiraceae bacterium]
MDNFLREFKDKIESVPGPVMTQDKWNKFTKYREFYNVTPIKPIAIVGKTILSITSAAAISLSFIFSDQIIPSFSYESENQNNIFVNTNKNENNQLTPNINQEQIETKESNLSNDSKSDTYDITSQQLEKQNSIAGNTKISINQKIHTDNIEVAKINADNFSNSKNVTSIPVNQENTKIQSTELNKNEFSNSEITNNETLEKNSVTDKTVLASTDNPDFTNKITDNNINQEEFIATLNTIPFNTKSITNSNPTILDNPPVIAPTYIIKQENCRSIKIWADYDNITGINDRLDMNSLTGSSFGLTYMINNKFGISANIGTSKYSGKINSYENYPFLNELQPHHPEDIIKSISMNAVMKKIGIGVSYDIISYKNLKLTSTLSIEDENYTNFDFDIEIYNFPNKIYTDKKSIDIIDKNRIFISPEVRAELAIYKGIGVYIGSKYNYSLSQQNEQYLNINGGVYCVL